MTGMMFFLSLVSLAAGPHREVAASGARAEITLTMENTFQPAGRAFGMSLMEDTGGPDVFLAGVNNNAMKIYIYTPEGVLTDSLFLDPANQKCFGVAWNPANGSFLTNDWETVSLFQTFDNGATWSTHADPAENSGRGLDFDGTHYWSTNGYAGVIRFTPGGASSNHATPEIADLLSGLALFPLQGGTGIALTTYSNHYIWFYEWNNTSLEYIGKAQCPAPCQPSAGLAYSHSRETLFWSYKVPSGDYMVSELSFEIGMALGQTTWGGIKTSF